MRNMGKAIILSTGLLLGGEIFAPVVPIGMGHAEAASLAHFKTSTYQTTANLKMRSGAGSKYKTILTIPKGKLVLSSQKLGNWYKVSYTYKSKGKTITKTGWSSGSYLKKKTISLAKTSVPKTVKFTKTTYYTSANVNMRAGANTSKKLIMTLKKGKTVTSNEKNGKWYKVSYAYTSKGKHVTKSGWVSGSYLKEYYRFTKTNGTYYFTNKTTKLYSHADKKNKYEYSIPAYNGFYSSQKVVNSIGQTWFRVSHNGKNLYVYSGDVSKASAKTFAKKDYQVKNSTYVYSSYGSVYKHLVSLPKGAMISTTQSVGAWYAVTYKGKKGYVPASAVQTPPKENNSVKEEKVTEVAKTYLVTADLNLRKSANSSSDRLSVIPNGSTVQSTTKTGSEWYKVTYKGEIGYVYGSYLKEYSQNADYRFIDLRSKSSVTAGQINNYIAANVNGRPSVLVGKGQAFIDAGNKYGINALYIAAHAIHESAFGTSSISLGKNNLFGYGAYDAAPFFGAYRFSSVEACINYVAQKMKADYLNPNGTHFEGAFLGYRTNDKNGTRITSKSIGMNYWYASDPNWGNGVARHMNNILKFDKSYYNKAAINTYIPATPGIPAGSDKLPVNIQVVAKKDLSSVIKKGTNFVMLEKTNDFRVKVLVESKQYWIDNIRFSVYKDYISVFNLGRVTISTLNVRQEPGKEIIGYLHLNNYVELELDKDKKVISETKDGIKWYKVKLSNGKTGWASSSYIARELK
ncbi:SH3 domain-containing protein [Neobacillus cucumis]|uniref:SH3 domain-containing protein n=1 Tax=Neobacillus cucumis TaxID=1740721 RepID=UPI0018E04AAE|nr:SH3 domain-containing protein [Neobacillus cucumis]MBI0577720.1 SH3 domain-containing protein [Neobacillus cucumis]